MSRGSERGLALVIALFTTTLMLAVGAALVLLTSSETAIAANFRNGHESLYAADAVLERALADLRNIGDWTDVPSGNVLSAFVDGDPSGSRALADGTRLDLAQVTNLANCQKIAACSDADLTAATIDRPWGASNPRWALYAYGPLTSLLADAAIRSPFYVVAFVSDDPSENDGDPFHDGISTGGTPNPGSGILLVRAESFGPRNGHRVIEATIARVDVPPAEPGGAVSTDLRVLSWRDVH